MDGGTEAASVILSVRPMDVVAYGLHLGTVVIDREKIMCSAASITPGRLQNADGPSPAPSPGSMHGLEAHALLTPYTTRSHRLFRTFVQDRGIEVCG